MNTEDYAIVIGLNHYPFLNSLKAAESDAEAFVQWLVDPDGGGLDPAHVQPILSKDYPAPNDPTSFNVHPLKNDIDEALVRLGVHERKRAGRRFYFYFAGHGIGLSFDEVALLLSGAAPELMGMNMGLAAYRQYFREAAPFDEVVLLLDCCRDLEERETAQPTPFKRRKWEERAPDVQDFMALGARFAKKAYEPVAAPGGDNRGLFTKVLLDGLKGAAADPAGNVTANTLRSYLSRQLPNYARQFGKTQKPDFEGNATDLLFCNIAHTWPEAAINIPAGWQGDVIITDDQGDELYRNAAPGAEWKVRLRKGKYDLVNVASGALQAFRVTGQAVQLEQEVSQPVVAAPAHLLVVGPHWLAEISFANGQEQVVAQAVGRLEKDLSPGDYHIDVSFSDGHARRTVTLKAGELKQFTSHDWGDVQFASAAPLEGTSTSHEYHMGPAVHLSGQVSLHRPGTNSRLFVFIRTVDVNTFPVNVTGLRLLDGDERLVCDFEHDVAVDTQAGFVALTADLPRGPYLLSYQPDPASSRTQPLWLSPGCETHVFIPCRERLHLDDMFLSMAPLGYGFQPNDAETQAVEAVLDGLQRGKNLASNERLQAMLNDKFTNPWLGILAVHALLLDGPIDPDRFNFIILNLTYLFGADHRDLRALALNPLIPDHPFDFPPLLRASLQRIQQHSIAQATTISPNSLTNKIYDGLLADSPWTAWRNLKEASKPRYAVKDIVNTAVFDQRGQTVHGPQTNIAGHVTGPVFSGSFHGAIHVGNVTIGAQPTDAIGETFAPLAQRVNNLPEGAEKEDAQDALGKLLAEARKPQADAGRVRRSLNQLDELIPGFRELAAQRFLRPDAGVGPVVVGGVQSTVQSGGPEAEAQTLSQFRMWIGEQSDEEISAALGLPWVRAHQARIDFLGAETLFAEKYGPVDAGILRYLWDQFEFGRR